MGLESGTSAPRPIDERPLPTSLPLSHRREVVLRVVRVRIAVEAAREVIHRPVVAVWVCVCARVCGGVSVCRRLLAKQRPCFVCGGAARCVCVCVCVSVHNFWGVCFMNCRRRPRSPQTLKLSPEPHDGRPRGRRVAAVIALVVRRAAAVVRQAQSGCFQREGGGEHA